MRQASLLAALAASLEDVESTRAREDAGRFSAILHCTFGGGPRADPASDTTPLVGPIYEAAQVAAVFGGEAVLPGRPNINEIVRTAAENAVAAVGARGSERARVLVWTCGPPAMLEAARGACDAVRSAHCDIRFADCVFLW